jgi:hypothetical protein
LGWTDGSLDMIANPGEGGHGEGPPQEGDVDAPGGPQQEHDVRVEGGRGLVAQNQPGEEIDKIDIKKLISNSDAMA